MPGANTIKNWVPDFIPLGITEENLTAATQGIENVNFSNLFAVCDQYFKVTKKLGFPFSITALVLFQDPLRAANLIANFQETFPNELTFILMLCQPQLAQQKFQANPNLCQSILPKDCNFLQIAAWLSDISLVNYLLNAASNLITNKDNLNYSVLFYAAASGELAKVELIYDKLPKALHKEMATSTNLDNVLCAALGTEKPEVIDFVLAKYPNLIKSKSGSENFLHYVVKSNLKSTIKQLCLQAPELLAEGLTSGLDLDDVSTIFSDEALVIKLLKQPNPEVKLIFEERSVRTLNRALHYAALAGCVKTMNLIGKKYKSIYNNRNGNLWSVLQCAIASKKLEAVKCLLNHEDSSKLGKTGIPKLHHTACFGTPEIFDYIMEFNPSESLWQDYNKSSVSGHAVRSGDPRMLEKVLAVRPSLLMATEDNWSLLHHAAFAPNPEAMLIYLFNHFTEESVKWWNKNNQKQTPDELFRSRQIARTPSVVLRELLLNALQVAVDNVVEKLEQAEQLIEFYKKRLLLLFSEVELFSQDQIDKMLAAPHLTKALGLATTNQLKQACKLKKIHTELHSQRLCKKNLIDILESTRTSSQMSATKFFASKSMLCTELGRLVTNIQSETSVSLSKQQVLTLSVILHDYQINGMHEATRLTDTLILTALESSLSLQELRPKAREMKDRDIKPENFLHHLDECQKLMPPLKEDTKKCIDIIFHGIHHIISDREKILTFVKSNPGKLYELGDNLPLHTDHIVGGNPEEYYATLQRLVSDFLGAFYLANDVGHLTELCEKMTSGYCLEAKLRDSLIWASGLSDIQKFKDLMDKYVEEYKAYQAVMNPQNGEDLDCAATATNFIMQHHKDFICEQDGLYARDGLVTEYGVRRYLVMVLNFDTDQPQKRLRQRNSGDM